MRLLITIATIISAVAMIFVLQNIEQTSVSFFNLSVEAPLAVILFITLVTGFISGALFMMPTVFRAKKKNKVIKEINTETKI
ncbi:MAG: putative integral membrane protein [Candidatus Paceibacteria bacterium]|jgi:uncharacterized integral membrane protein